MSGWRQLEVRGVPRGLVGQVTGVLFAAGAQGAQELDPPDQTRPPRQPWDTGAPPPAPKTAWVRAWFEDADEADVLAQVAAVWADPDADWTDVPEVDWEAESRASFTPLVVSDRLTIAPPWDAPEGALLIEPGQGFGTGEHPTTRQALVLLERVVDAGGCATALDVGCGSGVLALAAARMGLQASGLDVEAEAVANAEANAALNELVVPFSTTVVEDAAPADLVLANLHAELLVALATPIQTAARQVLILAGILAEKAPSVRAAYASWDEVDALDDGDWVALVLRRS